MSTIVTMKSLVLAEGAEKKSDLREFVLKRPFVGERKFQSKAVDQYIDDVKNKIKDPGLAWLFNNCFPNTLDTTVETSTFEGKPDTAVITGDIPAMWLRDSSAQVWPYLSLASYEESLRRMIEGVIRRQARCILIDPYANAFMADLNAPPLDIRSEDVTNEKPGVGERKWELDSLCWVIRLSHSYWKKTGDTRPFDAQWKRAMELVVSTMREQQRKHGDGAYKYSRSTTFATETLAGRGYGNPLKPVGMIASAFRPSDDACIFPFLIPANLFAVTSLRQLAEMATAVLTDNTLASQSESLAGEVSHALALYGKAETPKGTIWAYEVDGYGSQLLMDDAGLPSLLGLPYLGSSPDASLYMRTRDFVWNKRNPYFFSGTAGEGTGGPHVGMKMVWPMSQTAFAITSESADEIRRMLAMLKFAAMPTGFIHESYDENDATKFTRPWFAWANSFFGELVGNLSQTTPELLQEIFDERFYNIPHRVDTLTEGKNE